MNKALAGIAPTSFDSHISRRLGLEVMMKALGKTMVGLGTASVVGALGYYLYERNTESPNYEIIIKDGVFEVRDYPKTLVAETITTGSREEALNRGFRKLADYIFAKSRGGEKISMTAPVLQDPAQNAGWRTRFVMPVRHSRATLPPPPAGVNIDEAPARRVAAVRFSGRANDAALKERQSDLRRWMSKRGLEASGPAENAFYNSPFIPPFLRRNEILIPLVR
jgi:DNA gyrase inhibitor GyrI